MRAIVTATLVAALAVAGAEMVFRRSGGLPAVVPGMTRIEYQWKMRRAAERDGVVLYVVGDSRVGWGFAERVFNREYVRLAGSHHVAAANAGLAAAGIAANMRYILELNAHNPPQAIVLHYSPAAFYYFTNDPGPPIPGLKIQDVLDDRLDARLAEWLWTRGRWQEAARQVAAYLRTKTVAGNANFVHRSSFDDGFVNATLATNFGEPVDPPAYQLGFYRPLIGALRANAREARARRDLVADVVRSAQARGWTIVLVRFPLGGPLRDVEATLPQDLQPRALADALEVPFLDYAADARTAAFETLDGSHLTPAAARRLAPIVARDLFALLHERLDATARRPPFVP